IPFSAICNCLSMYLMAIPLQRIIEPPTYPINDWRYNLEGTSFLLSDIEYHLKIKETKELFKEKTCCFIEQYENYTDDNGMQINGISTERANVADNVGLRAAHLAYQTWVRRNTNERNLPGLKYTPDQLFWISAANVYCELRQPETFELSINSDAYSPGKFRVIGPMSNLPEFSKAFNCPSDSRMNRKNKCKIW
ncbi:endothelin-converting enzyme homolog, partial [Stegodyphus dumicola]|uniref:endothelin-converting enzyme homolog n=1 Tax=Stegodyphus dumicola TaxID=202533 RepID=UPI0015AA392F